MSIFSYGETDFHIGSECLTSYGVSFSLPKGSMLTPKFGEVIQRLLEAGLTRKWFKDAMDDVAKSSRQSQRPRHEVFTLGALQVQTCFYLLRSRKLIL